MINGAKVLTVNYWRDLSRKYETADTGDLQKTIADYQDLEEQEHDERLKTVALITRQAAELKKDKETDPAVGKSIGELLAVLQKEQREIAQAKANEAKQNLLAKKEEAAAKAQEEEEQEEEEEAGDHALKLLSALNRLKSSK